jgi:hypothetical protein
MRVVPMASGMGRDSLLFITSSKPTSLVNVTLQALQNEWLVDRLVAM